MSSRLTYLCLSCLLLFACKNSGKKEDQAATLKGIYLQGENYSVLVECSTGTEYWVNDDEAGSLKAIYKQHVLQPFHPIYIEMKGKMELPATEAPASAYDHIFSMKEIVNANTDASKSDCAKNFLGMVYELEGQSPRPWMLRWEKDLIRVEAKNPDTLFFFPHGEAVQANGEELYELMNERGSKMKIGIRKQPCTNAQGKISLYSSWIKIEGLDSFSGCGRLTPLQQKD